MNIQDIRQAYDSFLVRFAQVCNQGDYWIKYDGFAPKLIKLAGSKEQRISVEGILYLKGWPYKVVTRQKKIDILVAGAEHFDVAGSASVYSNVHVNYVDVNLMGA